MSARTDAPTRRAAVGLEAKGETTLGRFQYTPIEVGPLVVVPEIDFRVFATAQAAAGLFAGVGFDATFDAGWGFDSDEDAKFRSWGWGSSSFTPIWPTPFADATVALRAGPQLNLLVDGIAGPFVGIRGVLEYSLDAFRDPLWKVDAGYDVDVGLASASFIDKTYYAPVYGYRQTLITSNDTPPAGASPARTGIAGGSGVVVGPDDTIYAASGSTVVAFKKPAQKLWTFTADDVVQTVARAPAGEIYAVDFDTNIYALNANGTLKWKKPVSFARGLAIGATDVYTTAFGTGAELVGFARADGASWSAPIAGGNWGVSVGKDGTIYARSAELSAIDPTTHQILWTGGAGGGSSYPPAIGDDGTIYELDANGAVVATSPAGTRKWTSAPAFADAYRGLVVGPDGHVYACTLHVIVGYSPAGARTMSAVLPSGAFCRGAPAIGQDKRIYVAGDVGMYAYEPTGVLAWRQDRPYSELHTSPTFLSTKEVAARRPVGAGSI